MPHPILLVPGLGCTAAAFTAQLPQLWLTGPVMIANTLEGTTIAEIATAILAAAPPRFHLLGFSMGGYIAFEIMRQAPERVTGLCLLDTQARPDAPEATEKRLAAIALAEEGKYALAAAQSFRLAVHPDNADSAELKAMHVGMALAVGAETYVRHQRAIMARVDSRPDLGTIKMPTLIVVGEGDAITPPALAEEMHAGIPHSRLVVVPGGGHMAVLEQPDIVTEALLQWAAER
ncbi:alpha/beta fold hydrolase [Devosia sp.]|uniref:alpha/beta fold hydrolase n=1 Tax=Devosia sp. TaxID=1871048 RepID=UPI003A8F7969